MPIVFAEQPASPFCPKGTHMSSRRPTVPGPDEEIPAQPDNPLAQQAAPNRRATRRNGDIQRYTVDLDREQRRTLALCAAEWEVDKSRIIRTLLYLIEADESIRERVQQELETQTVL